MTSESEIIFHFTFCLFAYFLMYPSKEFVNIGLSIDQLCQVIFKYPSEEIQFIHYHLQRTVITSIVHSFIPLIYINLYIWNFHEFTNYNEKSNFVHMFWSIAIYSSIIIPIIVIILMVYQSYWSSLNLVSRILRRTSPAATDGYGGWWENHPIVNDLKKYTNTGQKWTDVATIINDEYRRPNKLVTKINSINSVIATENWILKTSPYCLKIAYQSDTALIAVKSDTHLISPDSAELVQFINIIVKPTRNGVKSFSIRVNAMDFKELQDRVHRPITILSGVNFNRSVIERFIETFRELVAENPVYENSNANIETCFACMQAEPNIKLQKCCTDIDPNSGQPLPDAKRCGNCLCRPMWCLECMAKWFASRQNDHPKEIWLQQKTTCPMCRALFCMLDVCLTAPSNSNGRNRTTQDGGANQ